MLHIRIQVVVACLFFAGGFGGRALGDPASDLAKYSVFPQVDLGGLANGKIVTARGPVADFPRDLSVQAVYVVHAPVARTLAALQQFDVQRHPELKVYVHRDFSTHPAPGDFAQSIPGNGAVRRLVDATEKLPDMGDLQLSKEEAAMFKGSGGGGGAFPADVRGFWSQVLYRRATAFLQRGLGGEPAYDSADGPVRVSDEVSRLLGEQSKVRAAFAPLIERSPLGDGVGSLPLSPYWELFDVEGEAAFSLGASTSVQSGGAAQALELQFYASGGYYVFITLYQMWPVTVNGQADTLVWRVDAISSLSLSDLRPFERMGSGAAMMKDVQRITNFFQKDLGR